MNLITDKRKRSTARNMTLLPLALVTCMSLLAVFPGSSSGARIYVSTSPDSYVRELHAGRFTPFALYVVAEFSPADAGMTAYEFSLDLPAGAVTTVDPILSNPLASDFGNGRDNFIVGTGGVCLEGRVVLATYPGVLFVDAPPANAVISLHPSQPSTPPPLGLPPAPCWNTCLAAGDVRPFNDCWASNSVFMNWTGELPPPCGGSGNQAPTPPENPSPADGATNQPLSVELGWDATDPDGDPLVFDVYFGTDASAPLVSGNQGADTYSVGPLQAGTTYFWRIVAEDDHGHETPGPTWQFSTGNPPVALCRDVTVSADASCTADASIDDGSYDPDGDPITLTQTPPGPYPVGTTAVTLTVTDDKGASDTCAGEVTVIGGPAGAVTVTLSRDVLWPPNHKMADVYATVTVTGGCCPTPPVYTLVSVISNEPDDGKGDGNKAGDIAIVSNDHVQLRSERSGNGDGRIYTLNYEVVYCGHTTMVTAEVRVPHDKSGTALACTGFRTIEAGIGLDPQLDEITLVVRSKAAEYGIDPSGNNVLLSPAFDATAINVAKAYVGNVRGVTVPLRSMEIDNNADGLKDVALFYSAPAVNMITQVSAPAAGEDYIEVTETYGQIGLHYRSGSGIDYLVPDIFALGEPVPLVPEIRIGRGGGLMTTSTLPEAPSLTALSPCYPNPFNPSTTIPFSLEKEEIVKLGIYDATGRLVRTLEDGAMPAGPHLAVWDGQDARGQSAATGVYFVRLVAGSFETTQKIVLLK